MIPGSVVASAPELFIGIRAQRNLYYPLCIIACRSGNQTFNRPLLKILPMIATICRALQCCRIPTSLAQKCFLPHAGEATRDTPCGPKSSDQASARCFPEDPCLPNRLGLNKCPDASPAEAAARIPRGCAPPCQDGEIAAFRIFSSFRSIPLYNVCAHSTPERRYQDGQRS